MEENDDDKVEAEEAEGARRTRMVVMARELEVAGGRQKMWLLLCAVVVELGGVNQQTLVI